MNNFKCAICSNIFTRPDNLKRHINNVHKKENARVYQCQVCAVTSTYKANICAHMKKVHGVSTTNINQVDNQTNILARNLMKPSTSAKSKQDDVKCEGKEELVTCIDCNITLPPGKLACHRRTAIHRQNCETTLLGDGVELVKTAFENRIATYRIKQDMTNVSSVSLEIFFQSIKKKVLDVFRSVIEQHNCVKVFFELFAWYMIPTKHDQNGDILHEIKSFNSSYQIVTIGTDIDELYASFYDVLKTKSEEFQEKDSGWSLVSLLYLEINVAKYNPLRGSTYLTLPKEIETRNAIINIQNSDNRCFAWSILSALHPVLHNAHRTSNYEKYLNELNFEGISFPVLIKDIKKFEHQNRDISVNVFGIEQSKKNNDWIIIGPLYHTQERKPQHVNLLYLEGPSNKSHYCWIKHMSRLVRSQLTKNTSTIHICDGCLIFFRTESGLKEHRSRGDCQQIYTILPEPGKHFLEFKDFHLCFKIPFCVYSDFETILKPIQNCTPNPEESYTVDTHVHIPHSFAYFIKCSYDETLSVFKSYRGKDCAAIYVKWLMEDIRRIYKDHFKNAIAMKPLTVEEKSQHAAATNCFICGEKFQDHSDNDEVNNFSLLKVKDHDHFTGNYRGPAHSKCNLKYSKPQFIPVFLHNMSNYDVHLFVMEAAAQAEKVSVIPQNKEKYIGFFAKILVDDEGSEWEQIDKDNSDQESTRKSKRYITIRFLDSFRFMTCSLETLASNLQEHQFIETRKAFPNDNEFKMVTRKGIFPYEYVDSYEKLESTVELPLPEKFYSTLTESAIDEEDYAHAKMVWNTFECKTLADYSDLYLKTDVLLLTDVFEAFRTLCMDIYGLETCNFMTLPSLSWKAMMKYTKVKLELFTDIDMLHFIRKSIRGGVAVCSHRHAVANNKYMAHQADNNVEFDHLVFKEDQDSRYLIYLDANNLYGFALSQYLPHSDFKWLTEEEIARFDITKCSNNESEIGYILEVDIIYPHGLHDDHDELPFCPENIVPPNGKSKQAKLIPNLFNKKKYVLHYRNALQAHQHGLIIKKIHRILAFKQSDWLKKYIDLNTRKRQEAKNDFEKNFYKLANNAIYGKCLEAVEKRVDVRLINNWEKLKQNDGAENLIAKPNFHSLSIFNENFVAIQMKKLKCKFDKPIYVGFSVLDISKTTMYSFHYDYIKNKYNERAKLLYTDTDSLVYCIQCDDIYKDIKQNIDKFDTSNYKQNNPYGIPLLNKAVLGVFKDENAGVPMTEFVGLRAKLYDIVLGQNILIKKAKGIKKSVVKRLKHSNYKDCLLKKKIFLCQQNIFKSIKHIIHTQTVNKIALSPFDDKRFILNDGISTYAWGNKHIP